MTVARRVLVDGRVQGVGFRQACAQMARHRHLGGWVRNRRDGRVEAFFEGPAADVAAVVEWCRHGPVMASVTDVHVTDANLAGTSSFRIAATE